MESNQSSLSNILFNIFIPVMILNKGGKVGLTPSQALLIALAFPLFFGLYSLIKEKKMNYISVLGLINILFSGILTILALGGIWFAVKEAQTPFFKILFLNPGAFNVSQIHEKLDTDDKKLIFERLMKTSTQWLSASFLVSAILNFGLSLYIFTPLSESLSVNEKQELLNQQLSQMTMTSLVVILVPMMLFVGSILYFAFRKTTKITGLTMDQLFIK